MAVRTIPDGCYLQPNNTDYIETSGLDGFTAEVKGSYSALETWMRTFVIGTDTFDGHVITARNLRRVPGNLGVLRIELSDGATGGSGESELNAYKGVWSFKAARNDVSILAYCGSAAQRVHIELWQKETSATVADADKYRDDDGTEHELTSSEKKIVDKIRRGRETVIKFYPILTYTCYYKSCPKNWAVDIGLIRPPAAATADRIIAPANINSVISGFVWLKVQDDVDEMPEGGFKRVMSWWGIHANDGGWDQDFYGENRWPMPLTSGSNA